MKIKLSTTHGDITLDIYEDLAPETAKNFLAYVKDGFYNGTLFHRVINKFMIQGGGFDLNFKEKATREAIRNEADNRLSNERGTIAMARTNAPHSASSQFFINLVDNGFLNYSGPTPQGWGYCVFGKVIDGMDTVDKIAKVATASRGHHDDVPKSDVVVERAEIIG